MPRPFKQLRELDVAKLADDMAADMTTSSVPEDSEAA